MNSADDMELLHGSGNVFRDFGRHDADLQQAKALMASQIIKILEKRQWTTRKAQEATGVNHTDFSRIRGANLSRFTIDRLLMILSRLGQDVELSVRVRPRKMVAGEMPSAA